MPTHKDNVSKTRTDSDGESSSVQTSDTHAHANDAQVRRHHSTNLKPHVVIAPDQAGRNSGNSVANNHNSASTVSTGAIKRRSHRRPTSKGASQPTNRKVRPKWKKGSIDSTLSDRSAGSASNRSSKRNSFNSVDEFTPSSEVIETVDADMRGSFDSSSRSRANSTKRRSTGYAHDRRNSHAHFQRGSIDSLNEPRKSFGGGSRKGSRNERNDRPSISSVKNPDTSETSHVSILLKSTGRHPVRGHRIDDEDDSGQDKSEESRSDVGQHHSHGQGHDHGRDHGHSHHRDHSHGRHHGHDHGHGHDHHHHHHHHNHHGHNYARVYSPCHDPSLNQGYDGHHPGHHDHHDHGHDHPHNHGYESHDHHHDHGHDHDYHQDPGQDCDHGHGHSQSHGHNPLYDHDQIPSHRQSTDSSDSSGSIGSNESKKSHQTAYVEENIRRYSQLPLNRRVAFRVRKFSSFLEPNHTVQSKTYSHVEINKRLAGQTRHVRSRDRKMPPSLSASSKGIGGAPPASREVESSNKKIMGGQDFRTKMMKHKITRDPSQRKDRDLKSRIMKSKYMRSEEENMLNELSIPRKVKYLSEKTHFDEFEVVGIVNMFFAITKHTNGLMDQNMFRYIFLSTFGIDNMFMLDHLFYRFDSDREGTISESEWVLNLSILLRGNLDEQIQYCFEIYDVKSEGFLDRTDVEALLRDSLVGIPGKSADESDEANSSRRELCDLIMRRLDERRTGMVTLAQFRRAVIRDPLYLQCLGQCLPYESYVRTFMALVSEDYTDYRPNYSLKGHPGFDYERDKFNPNKPASSFRVIVGPGKSMFFLKNNDSSMKERERSRYRFGKPDHVREKERRRSVVRTILSRPRRKVSIPFGYLNTMY